MKNLLLGAAWLPTVLLLAANAAPSVARSQDCAADVACPGFALSAGYTLDFKRNTTGGLERGNATSGLLELGAVWTTDTLLPGALVTSTASLIHTTGGAISGRYVGDLQGLNNIEAPAALRLYELWSEIEFGRGGSVSTRMGLLDLNAEFDAPVTSAFFIGPPFGIGTDLAQTGENGPAVFPVTSLGLRVAGKLGASHWRMAAFDGVPGRVDHESFATVDVSHHEGALLISEIEAAPAGFNKLAMGAWTYTSRFTAIDASASGDDATRRNRGAYTMADLPLGQIGAARVNGVLRAGVAAGRVNAIDRFLGAAVVISHLSGRPEDAVGLAIAHGRTSDAFQRQQDFDGATPRRSETQVELTWRTPARPWLAVVPSLQWVAHPGADHALRNAFIVGMRFELSLDHDWPSLVRQADSAHDASLAMSAP
ncbi:MAG TPA: carbohydrate porin [Steroidobacteraceae bacterium]|nr:carbohydrate porin [Steroidobacteraceae bacterium]